MQGKHCGCTTSTMEQRAWFHLELDIAGEKTWICAQMRSGEELSETEQQSVPDTTSEGLCPVPLVSLQCQNSVHNCPWRCCQSHWT